MLLYVPCEYVVSHEDLAAGFPVLSILRLFGSLKEALKHLATFLPASRIFGLSQASPEPRKAQRNWRRLRYARSVVLRWEGSFQGFVRGVPVGLLLLYGFRRLGLWVFQ